MFVDRLPSPCTASTPVAPPELMDVVSWKCKKQKGNNAAAMDPTDNHMEYLVHTIASLKEDSVHVTH